MLRKGSNHRFYGNGNNNNVVLRSRISFLMLSMFATVASLYVAGRLWQDAQNRVYIVKELDRITGQGQNAISVDDSLKVIACREQQRKLEALQAELGFARQEGFVPKYSGVDNAKSKKKPLVVIGILTSFGRKNKRDAVRKAWMGTGSVLKKLENEKGIVARFVIGRSENRGDTLDLGIDIENRQNNDFIILDDHVETSKQLPKKTMFFFAHVANKWDAEFYAKINDDVYVNIDALGNTLAAQVDKPRVYLGCMKSGEVFSEPGQKWYEPEWWKFGDGKSYFRHALVKYLSYHKHWPNLFQQTDQISALTPMMMSALAPGLLALMSSILMIRSFAVHPGHQELFVQAFDEECGSKFDAWETQDQRSC